MRLQLFLFFSITITTLSASAADEVVFSKGIGKDLKEAISIAVANGVTNQIGSFIDYSSDLEKETTIRDGVRTFIKKQTTDIKEYSRGAVTSVEVLKNRKLDSGLYEAVIELTIDGKRLVALSEEVILPTIGISSGLKASVGFNQQNVSDGFDIFVSKVLTPISKSFQWEIGGKIDNNVEEAAVKYLRKNRNWRFDGTSVPINIPLVGSMAKNYVSEVINTLESIAQPIRVSKTGELYRQDGNPSFVVLIGDFAFNRTEGAKKLPIKGLASLEPNQIKAFAINDSSLATRLCSHLSEKSELRRHHGPKVDPAYFSLNIGYLDTSGEEFGYARVGYDEGNPRTLESDGVFPYGAKSRSDREAFFKAKFEVSPIQYTGLNGSGSLEDCFLTIDTSSELNVAINLSTATFQKLSQLNVVTEFVPSNPSY